MSARGPPTPAEIIERFDLTPEEAEAVAGAISPINDLTSVGEDVGVLLGNADSPAPQLLGAVLKNVSKQVDLAASNTETMAKAIQFYVARQRGLAGQFLVPPEEAAAQFNEDIRPLVDALRDITPQQ